VIQRGVDATERDQLVVRARLDDPPASSTTIRSASCTVLTRWAMISVVFPPRRDLSEPDPPRLDVDRRHRVVEIRIGVSTRIARARVVRCRWPPESESPRSPTTVS
jgi:hypothetical protein